MISIIMPLYNAVGFMEETVQSVLEQSYKEWELLIVDDCSTDGSYEKALSLAERDSRIRVFQLAENSGGPAAPRNHGIARASGEYIAFLDADDVWYRDKLKSQMDYLQRTGKLFTSAKARLIDKDSKVISSKGMLLNQWRKNRKKKETIKDLIKNNFIITSSVLVKKELIGPFNEESEMVAVEDLCQWLEVFHKHPYAYGFQNETLLDYRVLQDSISQRRAGERHNTKMLYCITKFLINNNLTDHLDTLRLSLWKSQISKLFKKMAL